MADALQKIDRLIEGQGKLIELVTRAGQNAANAVERADYAATMTEITAKGVANLTVSMQNQFDDLKAGQETILQYLREKLP